MKVWRREGNRYKSVLVEDVPREFMIAFTESVGAYDIDGPFMIDYCASKFDDFEVVFYIYYYDYDVRYYVNRQEVPVTPELMNILRDIVKEEEEEECDECRLVPRSED